MRYDVEVRSQINGAWVRRYFTVEAETGDDAAARAKIRAARALPAANVHLSYAVRPSEEAAAAPPSPKAASAKRPSAKKRHTA